MKIRINNIETEVQPGTTILKAAHNIGMVPGFIEEKCKHCMLCVPVCPDSSIPVKDGKRLDFDFMHCKGCGICYKVCPFGAITYEKEEK